MERVAVTQPNNVANPDRIFRMLPSPGLAARLASTVADTARELSAGTSSYLRVACCLSAPKIGSNQVRELVVASLTHPGETIRGALAKDQIQIKRRRAFSPYLRPWLLSI